MRKCQHRNFHQETIKVFPPNGAQMDSLKNSFKFAFKLKLKSSSICASVGKKKL
jgi:hypothetical protein